MKIRLYIHVMTLPMFLVHFKKYHSIYGQYHLEFPILDATYPGKLTVPRTRSQLSTSLLVTCLVLKLYYRIIHVLAAVGTMVVADRH